MRGGAALLLGRGLQLAAGGGGHRRIWSSKRCVSKEEGRQVQSFKRSLFQQGAVGAPRCCTHTGVHTLHCLHTKPPCTRAPLHPHPEQLCMCSRSHPHTVCKRSRKRVHGCTFARGCVRSWAPMHVCTWAYVCTRAPCTHAHAHVLRAHTLHAHMLHAHTPHAHVLHAHTLHAHTLQPLFAQPLSVPCCVCCRC